jgi:hypothetical protein
VPAPTPTPVPVRLPAPGRLEIAFQHSLKQGTLQVLVDEKAILTRPLDKEKEKALLLKHTAQGRVLGFSPGSHSVRVQVQSGKDVWAGRIQGTFKSGETLRLKAKLGGFLGKKLSLEWQG